MPIRVQSYNLSGTFCVPISHFPHQFNIKNKNVPQIEARFCRKMYLNLRYIFCEDKARAECIMHPALVGHRSVICSRGTRQKNRPPCLEAQAAPLPCRTILQFIRSQGARQKNCLPLSLTFSLCSIKIIACFIKK